MPLQVMPIRDFVVLLDLDGTLVDSRPGIVASLHAALRELGHVPDPALDMTFFIGRDHRCNRNAAAPLRR